MSRRASWIALALVAVAGSLAAQPAVPSAAREGGVASTVVPTPLKNVGYDQRLGAQVPLDLPFRDEAGRSVRLGDLFDPHHHRPVVFALAYYSCPMLCSVVLADLAASLKVLSFDAGRQFDVLVVSFDPRDTPALAAAKKREMVARYGHPGAAAGIHYWTGSQESIAALTQAVGFRYYFDRETRQFAHAAGVLVLTPGGRVARYVYGIGYPARDLRLALVEASGDRIGSPVDQLLLYCFHYNPVIGRYSAVTLNLVRLGGAATLLGLFVLVVTLKRRESRPRGEPEAMRTQLPLFPQAASLNAHHVDLLTYVWLTVSGFFSLLIAGLILFYMVRYRRRSPGQVGVEQAAPLWLEIAWSAIPLAINLAMFGWGARIYFDLYRPPANAVEYFAIGRQWMWKFQHPEGNREINQLHVPVGQAVKMTMTSEDVIHSFYVPAFRLKQDVLPGRYTTVWFRPDRTGTYHLFCAEYCGTEHSLMIGSVVVMEPTDYEAWLSGSRPGVSTVASGAQLFQTLACVTCHAPAPGMPARAPRLEGLFGRAVKLADGRTVTADDNYIRESILSPAAKVTAGWEPIMPTFQGQVTEEQLVQLVAYVKSLAAPAGEATGAGATSAVGASTSPPSTPRPR